MQVEEQLLDHVEHLLGPGVVAVDLVEHEHGRQVGGDGLRQHVAGLGQRPLGRIDEQHHAVDHGQRPLDLAAEVGVAGRVDQVDPGALPLHRGRLGQDRDAPLALLVVRVHDPVDQLLVGVEHPGRSEHGVDQRGLAVVDVGDERDGTKGCGHYRRLDFDDMRGVLETATFVVGILFLPGEAPPGVVGPGDGTALNARLGVLWPKERVEVVVCSLERSGLFEAPMTTLLHGSAPT